MGKESETRIQKELPPTFRAGTNDSWVWRTVVEGNEYFIPQTFSTNDVVIDVGMHIGSFTYLVLKRGAGHVYGFEASCENYALARRNLEPFKERITFTHGAVCRSDSYPDYLFFSGYQTFENGIVNTGGGDVFSIKNGKMVSAIPFDSIIDSATQNGSQRIRLLKLDCEGSEYPILMTSRRLHLIDEIVGEYHEIQHKENDSKTSFLGNICPGANLDGEVLADFLSQNGFAVRLGGKSHIWGKFFAWNKASLPSFL